MRRLKLASHVGVFASGVVILGLWAFRPSDSYDSGIQVAFAGFVMVVVGLLGLMMRLAARDEDIFVGPLRLFATICGAVTGGYALSHTDEAWESTSTDPVPMAPTDQIVTYIEAIAMLVFAAWGVYNMILAVPARRATAARDKAWPVTAEVADRVRRSRGTVVFLRWVMPLPPIVAALVAGFAEDDGFEIRLLFTPSLLLVGCAIYFARTRFDPAAWTAGAALAGAVGGFHIGVYLTVLMMWDVRSAALVFIGCSAAGGFCCRWIAARGRDQVLKPYTRDLVDSPIEVPFASTHDRRLTLNVGTKALSLSRDRFIRGDRFSVVFSFADITSAEVTTVAATHTLHVHGVFNQTMTVHSGPAVRIGLPEDGEWIFPTDQGPDVVHIIEARKQAFAAT
ncbi:hypothetical protein [Actinokineospora iranica]|nr:hypothetical protein [Actinokineospora iranica]